MLKFLKAAQFSLDRALEADNKEDFDFFWEIANSNIFIVGGNPLRAEEGGLLHKAIGRWYDEQDYEDVYKMGSPAIHA